MFKQSTSKREDGGVSGAKAFWTGAWSSNTKTESEKYKGFFLSCEFTGFRFASTRDAKWQTVKLDWKNDIDNELEEYDASNWSDYKTKYREKQKITSAEEKKEKEEEKKKYAEEGKDSKGNDTYEKLLKEIEDIKKDRTKPLELKEKDFDGIMERIDAKNQTMMDKINEKNELTNDQITQLSKELAEAKNNGDKNKISKIVAQINTLKEDLVKYKKEKDSLPRKDDIKKYLQDLDGGIWESIKSIDWTTPRPYFYSLILIGIIIASALAISWIIKKIRGLFSSNN